MSTRHFRRTGLSLLLTLTSSSSCQSAAPDPSKAAPPGISFTQHDLAGFLLGHKTANLAVVHPGKNATRHLTVYALVDGSSAPKIKSTLRPDIHGGRIRPPGTENQKITTLVAR